MIIEDRCRIAGFREDTPILLWGCEFSTLGEYFESFPFVPSNSSLVHELHRIVKNSIIPKNLLLQNIFNAANKIGLRLSGWAHWSNILVGFRTSNLSVGFGTSTTSDNYLNFITTYNRKIIDKIDISDPNLIEKSIERLEKWNIYDQSGDYNNETPNKI